MGQEAAGLSDSERRRNQARLSDHKKRPRKWLVFASLTLAYLGTVCLWSLYKASRSCSEFSRAAEFVLDGMEASVFGPPLVVLAFSMWIPPLSILAVGLGMWITWIYLRLCWRVRTWRPMLALLIAHVALPIGTEVAILLRVPEFLAIVRSQSELKRLALEVRPSPLREEPPFEPRYVGSFYVRRAFHDHRGGVYFDLISHNHFLGLGTYYIAQGVALDANRYGTPFGDSDYSREYLYDGWSVFHLHRSSR